MLGCVSEAEGLVHRHQAVVDSALAPLFPSAMQTGARMERPHNGVRAPSSPTLFSPDDAWGPITATAALGRRLFLLLAATQTLAPSVPPHRPQPPSAPGSSQTHPLSAHRAMFVRTFLSQEGTKEMWPVGTNTDRARTPALC